MIIDAKGMVLGRLGTYVAKQLLLGGSVEVINCEESVISGKREHILESYLAKKARKAPRKGPYFYKRPDMFVKRTIRGMLPFKMARGRDAFSRLKCHIGIPDEFKRKEIINYQAADGNKLLSSKVKVGELCMAVGWKEYDGR